ncbi:ABC transporter ATP-binding protein [Catenuloplanes atrovinosus]|uniref:ABC-2 type transport system ATP-binding protein n=1 Tax=Catenuloplanes atrovinosus TaxID=137266 RepID=A0AAE3YTL1_9ACTN|nr:ABC transporter ATP-binding protein [Catenuloplanes atrovinosus]MDR7278416.1 ABC-2 type transport system ATP-binding protein [Catenuloplanes atrovinosus]
MGTPAPVAIAAEHLTKWYADGRGVHDLSLTVPAGEVFGLLGPSGAGKTTTLRMLLDLVRPSAGRVSVLGEEPSAVAVRARIGYCPAELTFERRESVLSLLHALDRARGGRNTVRLRTLADRLGLDTGRRARSLSPGNRRRLGLVAAFMHDPDLLLLDEPAAGLDPAGRSELLALIRETRERGRTVVLCARQVSDTWQVADRVGVLHEGRLVAVERVEQAAHRQARRVQVHFAEPVPRADFFGLPGVTDLGVDGRVLWCAVDGPLDPLIKAAARHTVTDMIITEPTPSEALIDRYYTAVHKPFGNRP